jgi:hypothetical protein
MLHHRKENQIKNKNLQGIIVVDLVGVAVSTYLTRGLTMLLQAIKPLRIASVNYLPSLGKRTCRKGSEA